ncbi:MAG TPA: M20/M25/M40 family metallo-hydrolase [Chloroflexia bacterium]|jgi:acetylornithine deacetylase/succinyl-diaminopimelate desuccinylase-like protein
MLTRTEDDTMSALEDECVRHLQALIRLDTSNPPGNEILAVEYIRQQLAEAEVDAEVVESEPGRANLRAVLKGDGSERPLLLMSHTDVVPVEPEFWTRAPFSGDIDSGYVWGRGAVDMKQWVAWHLTIFLDLARRGVPLKRDVVLLCTADEEDGSYKGMRWIAENMPEWLDGEYGLSEGGGGEMQVRGKSFFPCRVAEKGACRFRLRAHGSPGHASRPHSDNAIVKLGVALGKLGSFQMPIQASDIVRGMLERIFEGEPRAEAKIGDLLNEYTMEMALQDSPLSPAARLTLNAQLRNTAAPTILHAAGSRINVIPSTAEADVDGRVLPGVSMDEFARQITEIVGPDVEVEVYEYWPGSASSFDTELFRIMQDVTKELTGATLVPFMATGASDGRFAEPLGVDVYGFGLMRDEPGAAPSALMHAHDERISLSNVHLGLRALHETVLRIVT